MKKRKNYYFTTVEVIYVNKKKTSVIALMELILNLNDSFTHSKLRLLPYRKKNIFSQKTELIDSKQIKTV